MKTARDFNGDAWIPTDHSLTFRTEQRAVSFATLLEQNEAENISISAARDTLNPGRTAWTVKWDEPSWSKR